MHASETPCAAVPIHLTYDRPEHRADDHRGPTHTPWHGPLPPYVRAVGHVARISVSALHTEVVFWTQIPGCTTKNAGKR